MSITKTICSRHMSIRIGLWNKVAWFNAFHFFLKVDIKVCVCHHSLEAMVTTVQYQENKLLQVVWWFGKHWILSFMWEVLYHVPPLSPLRIMASLFMTSLLQRQWPLSAEWCTLTHCMSYTRMVLEAWKRFHSMILTTKLPRLQSYTYGLCWPKLTLQNLH